ncbi:MAG: S-layer homology domain-containing protein, partial [Clostridia bacterium]
SPTLGTTLTATYADGNGTGAATYTWTVGTATVVTGTAAYTAVPVDAGKSVTVSVSFADQTGSVTSAATSAVAKKDFAGAVTAPEEQAKTATSVTLKAVQGYEYAKAAAGDAVPTVFADSAQFGGLTANTTYDFYQRAKETADTKASAASAKTSITTGSAPSGASLTVNKVINLPNDTETQIDYVVVTVNGAVKGDVVEIYTSQAQGATPIATQIITATAESQKITINLPENALSKRVIGKVFVAVKDKVAQVAANYAEEISLSISKPVMSVGYPSFCDITFPQGVSIKSGTDIVWKSSMIYAVTIQSHDNERATLFGAGAGQSLVSATGKFNHPDPDKAGQTIKAVAEAVITVRSGGGGTDSGTEGGDTTSFAVYYDVGAHGTISGATSESVVNGRKPARVPNVVAASGYLFKGWSINGTTIVIPQMYTVRSSTTFKAVYEQIKDPQLADEHKAYIGGYSDGTFRPENKITRAEAVAMFARIMKTP